ncbi:hypothetical protein [Microbacterium aurantiacum]|uniref:hypothetical protein n=1 Tax=Microbacterium aurantiacum TaxID=162393 RepID=UPI00343F7409
MSVSPTVVEAVADDDPARATEVLQPVAVGVMEGTPADFVTVMDVGGIRITHRDPRPRGRRDRGRARRRGPRGEPLSPAARHGASPATFRRAPCATPSPPPRRCAPSGRRSVRRRPSTAIACTPPSRSWSSAGRRGPSACSPRPPDRVRCWWMTRL